MYILILTSLHLCSLSIHDITPNQVFVSITHPLAVMVVAGCGRLSEHQSHPSGWHHRAHRGESLVTVETSGAVPKFIYIQTEYSCHVHGIYVDRTWCSVVQGQIITACLLSCKLPMLPVSF